MVYCIVRRMAYIFVGSLSGINCFNSAEVVVWLSNRETAMNNTYPTRHFELNLRIISSRSNSGGTSKSSTCGIGMILEVVVV